MYHTASIRYTLVTRFAIVPTPLILSSSTLRLYNYKQEPSRISPPPEEQNHTASRLHNYSNVNVGNMLPPELRTTENLMGGSISDDQTKGLLESHQKELQQYEEAQLKLLKQQERQKTAGRPVDVYTNPADAIQNHVSSQPKGVKVGSPRKASPPQSAHKFHVRSEGASAPEDDRFYSDVFDKLPPNQAESIGRPVPKSVRAMSDSQSPIGRRYDPGYEDVGDLSSSSEGGTAVKPNSLPSGSLGDINISGDQEINRYSGPHGGRRESSKEMVRLDPKTRSFRLTSESSTKKTRVDREDPEPEDSNFNNNNKDTVSPTQVLVASMDDVDAVKLKQKEAAFEIEEVQPGSDSYAMVNVADKQQYRAEADGDRCEGSGIPRHYSVKDSPTKLMAESTAV